MIFMTAYGDTAMLWRCGCETRRRVHADEAPGTVTWPHNFEEGALHSTSGAAS